MQIFFLSLQRDAQKKKSKTTKLLFKSVYPFFITLIGLGSGLRDLPDTFLVFLKDEATADNPSCVRIYRIKHKKVN